MGKHGEENSMREGKGKETMKQMRKIDNSRDAQLLFLLCWFAYFTSYIGRLNYSSAMTAMIQEAVLTKSQAGFISMVYFFAYGIGQFCNGMLGDRFHPGKMIFVGLAIAAGANLCMGFVGGFGAMAVVWGINGYAQAMIWPPVIRIFAEMVSREQKMKFCVNIVSSQVVGTLASYLLAAVVMWLIGWRAVFGAAAICLCVMSVIWIIGFEKIEKCGKDPEEETADVDNDESTAAKTANTGKQAWLGFGILMVLFPVIIHGMLKDVYYGDFPHISGIFHSGDNHASDRQFDRGLSGAVPVSEMQKTRNSCSCMAVSARSAGSDGHLDRKRHFDDPDHCTVCDDNGIYDGC